MTLTRVGTGVSLQAGNAALAAATAALNSSVVVRGRRETMSCVACSIQPMCVKLQSPVYECIVAQLHNCNYMLVAKSAGLLSL